jgi:hypothetical protein
MNMETYGSVLIPVIEQQLGLKATDEHTTNKYTI